ncbi:MAG: hypothetical protein GY861_20935 [bacterium]|nr:hypothetical protein [bacterium]
MKDTIDEILKEVELRVGKSYTYSFKARLRRAIDDSKLFPSKIEVYASLIEELIRVWKGNTDPENNQIAGIMVCPRCGYITWFNWIVTNEYGTVTMKCNDWDDPEKDCECLSFY